MDAKTDVTVAIAADSVPVRLWLAALALPCVLHAPVAAATETRVGTLQNIGGIQDETDVFTFPELVTEYNLALIELGTSTDKQASASAFYGTGSVSGGIALSRSDWLIGNGGSGSLFDRFETAVLAATPIPPAVLQAPAHPVELFYGTHLGHDQALGFRLAFAQSGDDQTTGTGTAKAETKYSAQQIEAGAGFSANSGHSELDTALAVILVGKQKKEITSTGSDSEMSVTGKDAVSIDARWLMRRDSSAPFVRFAFGERHIQVENTTNGDKKSGGFSDQDILLEGGYAAIMKQHEAKLFVGANLAQLTSAGPLVTGSGSKAAISYTTHEGQETDTTFVASASLAGEGELSGGFGAMFGMSYALYGTITTDDLTAGKDAEKKETQSIPETPDSSLWSLGLFYKVAALRVDASYSKSFLHNGPFLISGKATDPLFGKISASWNF